MKVSRFFSLTMALLFLFFSLSFVMISCDDDDDNDDGKTAVEGNQVGNLAFDFSLMNKDEVEHTLSNYKGMVILLNFGATW